jgi:hypothetical protein
MKPQNKLARAFMLIVGVAEISAGVTYNDGGIMALGVMTLLIREFI